MWAARSRCAPTGGTTSRARTGSSGWWTALTASAWRTAGGSCRVCWWRSAWPGPPSSSSPISRTCLERCPPTPSGRPWSWTPSAATTGASRAAAPSRGRTCCPASTGSWTTSPAASSPRTELLPEPWAPRSSPGSVGGQSTSPLTLPAPLHNLLLLLLPPAAPGLGGLCPCYPGAPHQGAWAGAGRGLPLLLPRL